MRLLHWLFFKKKEIIKSGDSTPIKISDDSYLTNISDEQKQAWDTEQWKKDNVPKLLKTDGFHIKNHGRSGSIYYIDNGKMCEVYFEISGVPKYDILVFWDELDNWSLPQTSVLTIKEKTSIKAGLIDFLKNKKIKSDLS